MAVIVTALWGVNTTALVDAQARAGTAVIKTVSGQVEVQRKGDTQWVAAAAGARLAEGDQVRAHAGASSALDLPDGSILFVAENSRIVISKLEFDPQNQGRQAFFHLAVGKVRAAVSQAAISLVRARQSNFTISTPTAVAAARGTVFEVVYDATQNVMRVAVIVKDPRRVGRPRLVSVAPGPVLDRPGPRGPRDHGRHVGLCATHPDQPAPRCESGRHAAEPDRSGPVVLHPDQCADRSGRRRAARHPHVR